MFEHNSTPRCPYEVSAAGLSRKCMFELVQAVFHVHLLSLFSGPAVARLLSTQPPTWLLGEVPDQKQLEWPYRIAILSSVPILFNKFIVNFRIAMLDYSWLARHTRYTAKNGFMCCTFETLDPKVAWYWEVVNVNWFDSTVSRSPSTSDTWCFAILQGMQLAVKTNLIFCRKLLSKKSPKNYVNSTQPKVQE